MFDLTGRTDKLISIHPFTMHSRGDSLNGNMIVNAPVADGVLVIALLVSVALA
jgi:hypothetical protein